MQHVRESYESIEAIDPKISDCGSESKSRFPSYRPVHTVCSRPLHDPCDYRHLPPAIASMKESHAAERSPLLHGLIEAGAVAASQSSRGRRRGHSPSEDKAPSSLQQQHSSVSPSWRRARVVSIGATVLFALGLISAITSTKSAEHEALEVADAGIADLAVSWGAGTRHGIDIDFHPTGGTTNGPHTTASASGDESRRGGEGQLSGAAADSAGPGSGDVGEFVRTLTVQSMTNV